MKRLLPFTCAAMALALAACNDPSEAYTPVDELPSAQTPAATGAESGAEADALRAPAPADPLTPPPVDPTLPPADPMQPPPTVPPIDETQQPPPPVDAPMTSPPSEGTPTG